MCLVSFPWHKVFEVHLCCYMYLIVCLFLVLRSIVLYGYIMIYLFIHLSLDCFKFLNIVKNTAMNTYIQVFVWTYVFTRYLEMELIGHMASICLTAKLSSKVTRLFYMPSSYVCISPHSCQYLVLSVFVSTVVLVGIK